MKKSRKDLETSQLGLFSLADFHARVSPRPENGPELTTIATSGLRLHGLLASSGQTQSFLRMFLESQAFWSQRCMLTWKPKRHSRFVEVTRALYMNKASRVKWRLHSRSFKGDSWARYCKTLRTRDLNPQRRQTGVQSFYVFQLAVSALPTGGTGCGLLPTARANDSEKRGAVAANPRNGLPGLSANAMLPTPRCSDTDSGRILEVSDDGAVARVNFDRTQRYGANLADLASGGLLPTPDCNNHRDGTSLRKDNNMMEGGRHGVSLHHMAAHGLMPTPKSQNANHPGVHGQGGHDLQTFIALKMDMLPTPRAAEHKGTGPKGSKSNDHRVEVSPLDAVVVEAVGEEGVSTQLSHRFVMEMMGFPPDWVESAFAGTIPSEAHDFTTFPNEFPTVVPEWRDMMDGILGEAGATNPETGKPLNYSRLNKEGLKMGGNAIVPPVLLQIFIALEKSWE